jgi:hypothetical protein
MKEYLRAQEISMDHILSSEEKQIFLQLYFSPEDAEKLWNEILDEILYVYRAGHCQNQRGIVDILLNALPNLSLPHNSSHSNASLSDASCILDMEEKVKGFGNHLRSILPKTSPLCITVARSSDDGFTPSCVTDKLQHILFQELHSIFCACSSLNYGANSKCKIKILKDYGEFEGSSLEEMHL